MANLFRCGGNAKKNYEISASGTTIAFQEGNSWAGLSSSSVTVNGRKIQNNSTIMYMLINDTLLTVTFSAGRNHSIPTAVLTITIKKKEEIIAQQTFTGGQYGNVSGTVTCNIQL